MMIRTRPLCEIRTSFHSTYRKCCTVDTSWTERILSGIQPTGTMHLGNYIGAVRNWVNLQNSTGGVICSVVDLHSMTLRYDFKKLPENILTMVACLLACGINPKKSVLFLQSQIPEHTQLCWVLGCLCTSARLARMPHYREKSSQLEEVGLGLYIYPILQAADILIHQATKVPVGVDQVHHLQMARELAKKFNHIFGDTFPLPLPLINDGCGAKIADLRNPTKKMSKSSSTTKGRIEIMDSPDVILLKIKRALTDCKAAVSYDPVDRPGVSNLIAVHSSLTNRTPMEICEEVQDLNTGQYKLIVAEVVIETLKPIREEVSRLINDKIYLTEVIQSGGDRAKSTASETWKLVRERTGLHPNIC